LSNGRRLERFAAMLRARRFDETLIAHAELVTGVFHVSIGMEATAAALAGERAERDLITLNHRNHGVLAAIGCDPQLMYGEILGRDGGPQRGRAGTLHLADATRGVPYTSAMVAGGPALAVGMALARKRQREPGIVFAFLGDGALGEGAMHESLNLASLWQLPVLFVCESNAAAATGRANPMQAARTLHALAEVHQIPARAVDAGEAEAIAKAMREDAAAVRAGTGPHFIEARTPQWRGNASFIPTLATGPLDLRDAATAQPPAGWAQLDPLLREARALLATGVELAQLLELDTAVATAATEAFDRATAAAPAPPGAAFDQVWA
jgi:TPP-dependent pyruvate/acetoin dehydrogenase alpha subunit